MNISIRNNGDYIIEFNQFKVHGLQAAGGYGFTFLLKGNRRGCENPIVIFDIRLSLSLSIPVKPVLTSIPSSIQIIKCTQYPNTNEQLSFEVVLTKEQVNALEEYRQDKDLKLNIGLRALTSADNAQVASYEHEDVIVPREEWLGALNNAGFRQTILFEIPLPNVSIEFTSLYTKAQVFIETGHYKEAVIQCRLIIEQLESLREDNKQSRDANTKAHSNDRKNMTAIERLLSLREQLKNICQLGAHGSETFTRSQAKAVLGITMTLVAEPTIGYSSSMSFNDERLETNKSIQ